MTDPRELATLQSIADSLERIAVALEAVVVANLAGGAGTTTQDVVDAIRQARPR